MYAAEKFRSQDLAERLMMALSVPTTRARTRLTADMPAVDSRPRWNSGMNCATTR